MTTARDDQPIEVALEECCRRVRRGEPLEKCLLEYPPEQQQELGQLVRISTSLSRLGRDPSPDFQARLEGRLLASVDEARRHSRPGIAKQLLGLLPARPLARLAAVLLVTLAVLGGGGFGVDMAAAGTLPDNPLYRVKETRERIQLALAQSPEARLEVRAGLIAERGTEMERAVRAAKPARVLEVLEGRLARVTRNMVDQALERGARGNRQSVVRALVVLRAAEVRLERLSAQAPAQQQPVLQRMRSFLRQQQLRLVGAALRNVPAGTDSNLQLRMR